MDFESESGDLGGRNVKRTRTASETEQAEATSVETKLEKNITKLIVQLGDKATASTLETDCQSLRDVLVADLSTYKNKIIKLICECVTNMPDKLTSYSTLVALLNVSEYNFVGELVEGLVRYFKDHLKAQSWDEAAVLVRFFSDLVKCRVVSLGSLMSLYESMADVTLEDNIPQVRSDYYAFCILSALPFIGDELSAKKEQEFNQLLNTIESYLNKRNKLHHVALRVWYSDIPHPQEEYLDSLWAQISKLRSDKWIERHIFRPYQAFDDEISEALQHNLPSMQMPPHDPSYVYPYPRVVFRMFDYTDCPEGSFMPNTHAIERYLIEDQLLNILKLLYDDRRECANQMTNIDAKTKVALDYIIVEVVMGEIFSLPRPKFPQVCYGSLLLALCRLRPGSFPQVLAQAVELLYERLDSMNVSCSDRFANWFAYHLSNFQFKWSWEEWKNCLTFDPLHPKPKFVREVLVRCLRLSYHSRVVAFLPQTFHGMAPEDPIPINKYEDPEAASLPGYEAAVALEEGFKAKCTPEEAMQILESLPNPLKDSDDDTMEPNHHPLKIDIFVTVLLNFASKSFTHLFAGIKKFEGCLRDLNTSEEAQIVMLKTMSEVWCNHQQLMTVLIEKLLKARIIEGTAIVNWIFSPELAPHFTQSYIWEILHATIRRQIKQVESAREELEVLKAKKGKDDGNVSEEEEGGDTEMTNEQQLDKLEEGLEAALADQKNLFIVIFQRFIMVLSDHIQQCEIVGKTFKNHWFRWSIGRLQQVFFEHHEQIFHYIPSLESLLFTGELDQHILLIFKQFTSLRA